MAAFNETYSLDSFICFGFTCEDVYQDRSLCYIVDYKENAVYVNNFKRLITSNFKVH